MEPGPKSITIPKEVLLAAISRVPQGELTRICRRYFGGTIGDVCEQAGIYYNKPLPVLTANSETIQVTDWAIRDILDKVSYINKAALCAKYPPLNQFCGSVRKLGSGFSGYRPPYGSSTSPSGYRPPYGSSTSPSEYRPPSGSTSPSGYRPPYLSASKSPNVYRPSPSPTLTPISKSYRSSTSSSFRPSSYQEPAPSFRKSSASSSENPESPPSARFFD